MRTATMRLTTAALLAVLTLSALPSNADQLGCTADGKNMQCNEFGTIQMDAQRDIKGDPIDIEAEVYLNTNYQEQGARWVMFSIREAEGDPGLPLTLRLTHFTTDQGDIVTTRVDHDKDSEIDLWVDTLDLPANTPIHIGIQVGSTDRGGYRLEALVLAFDRGYAPMKLSDGTDASLFSFTYIGVNEATGKIADDSGGLAKGKKLPGFEALGLLLAVGAAVAIASRRSKA